MARPIDEKIVRMTLDNVKFLSNVKDTLKSLTSLNDGVKGNKTMDIGGLGESVGNIDKKFSLLGVSAGTVISKLTSSAMDMGKKLYDTVVGPIVEGGKKRALNIEQAKFQFQGLGMDVDKTMQSALEAVKGTAFGLDEAAVVASQFGATGMRAGKEMTDSLRGISGVAAMTGSSYSDIGSIFTTVAGNGRLMGSELLRLSGRGINAAATLSKSLGVTEAEVRAMVTDGKISFRMFSDAMSEAFGEHATRANETYVGSLSNVKAALSRIGAAIFAPEFENKRDIFNVLTPKIDDLFAAITPLIDVWTKFRRMGAEVLMKAISNIDFSGLVKFGIFTDLAKGFMNLLDSGKFILQAFASAWSKLFPSNGWHVVPRILKVITSAFKHLTSVVRLVASVISLVINIVGVAFSLISSVVNVVVRLGLAVLNIFPKFKLGGKSFIDTIADAVMWLSKLLEGFAFTIKEGSLIVRVIDKIGEAFGFVGKAIGFVLTSIFGVIKWIGKGVLGLGKLIGGTVNQIYNALFKGKFTKKGPWNEDSKIIGWLFKIRDAAIATGNAISGFFKKIGGSITKVGKIVGSAFKEMYNILFKGDFTGKGPWEEDSKIVGWLFKIREGAIAAGNGIVGFFKNIGGNIVSLGKTVASAFKEAYNILFLGDFTGKGPWEEDSKIVDWLFKIREAAHLVGDAVYEAYNILFMGNFTGRGPWEEDSKIVDWLFRIREAAHLVGDSVYEAYNILFMGNFTGRGPWEEDSKIVDWLFNIREAALDAAGGLKEAYNILFKGNFTGKGPWEEDSKIVDWLFRIREATISAVDGVKQSIKDLAVGIATGIWNKDSPILKWMKWVGDSAKDLIKYVRGLNLEPIGKAISDAFNYVRNIDLSPIGEGLVSMYESLVKGFNWILDGIKTVYSKLKEFVSNIDWRQVFAVGVGGGLVGIAVMVVKSIFGVFNSFKDFGGLGGALSDFVEGATSALEEVGSALKAFTFEVKSKALINIAIAVGILAVSLILLSGLDGDQIGRSLTAVVGSLGALVIAMFAMTKFELSGTSFLASVQIMALAGALIIMSDALKRMADLEWDEIGRGLASIGGLIALLTGSLVLISRFGGVAMGASSLQILAIAGAMYILVEAIYKLSGIKPDKLERGAKTIGKILMTLGLFIVLMSGTTFGASSAVGIMGIAAALLLMEKAIVSLGSIDMNKLIQGLLSIAAILGAIVGFAKLTARVDMINAGAGLLLLAGALTLLAVPIFLMGSMKLETLAKGIGAMAIALLAIAGASRLMVGVGLASLEIIAIAFAMSLLVPPIMALGAMKWESLAKGLVGLAGGILLLGGAAIVIGLAAVPLAIGTAALLAMGIAAGIAGLAIAAAGLGVALFGVGLALFATSLVTVAAMSGTAVVTIVSILGSLIAGLTLLIPEAVKMIAKLILSIVETMDEYGPQISDKFASFLLKMAYSIQKHMPEFADAGAGLMISFMDAIEEKHPIVMERFQLMIINIVNGMADSVEVNGPKLTDAFMRLMGQVALVMIDAGLQVISALFGWIPGVEEACTAIGYAAESTIREKFGAEKIGADKVDEFAKGAIDNIAEVERANTMVSEYGMASLTSVDYTPAGEENAGEYATGIDNLFGKVYDVTEGVSKGGLDGFYSPDHTPAGETNAGEYATGINNTSGKVYDVTEGVSKYGLEGFYKPDHTSAGTNNGTEYGDGITGTTSYVQTSSENLANSGLLSFNGVDASPAGNNFGIGFGNGIDAGWVRESVTSKAASLAGAAYRTVRNYLDINSPSRLMRTVGNFFGEGFGDGMVDQIGVVGSKAKSLAVRASTALSDALEVIKPKDDEIRFNVVVNGDSLDDLNNYQVAQINPDLSSINGVVATSRLRMDGLDSVMDRIRGVIDLNSQNESNNIDVLREQNEILTRIANKDTNFTINKKDMTDVVNNTNTIGDLGVYFP